MARVFVSHSGKDAALAGEVHRWLVDGGHEVFLGQDFYDGFRLGDQWEPRLHERLRWADAVVCVLTSAYLASVWCTAELAISQSRGSRLLPVRAEPGVLHPLLNAVQYVDMTQDAVAARVSMAEALLWIDAAGGLGWPDDRSPYPGLRPVDTNEHSVFFGRAREIDQLATGLRSPAERAESAIVVVVGPSGCGKSSLVRAGLLPVMAAEPEWWTLSAILPGTQPVAALARELTASARSLGLSWAVSDVRCRLDNHGLTSLIDDLLFAVPGRRRRHLLIVLDQVEELLTQTGPEERARFAALLRDGLAGPLQVVATLRPEFLGPLLTSPELSTLPARTHALRPLRPEALRAVIEGPADRAGITIDADLVTRLVVDTGSGEALPLLAYTLAQLADGVARGGRLSASRYEQLGGVQGALAGQADAALADAIAAGGRSAEEVVRELLRLVTVDEQGRPTRWRIRLDELPGNAYEELRPFIDRRLLATDSANGHVVLGVAHELFLSAWQPLGETITAAGSALRSRRQIEQAAAEWVDQRQNPALLWERGRVDVALSDLGGRLHAERTLRRNTKAAETAVAGGHRRGGPKRFTGPVDGQVELTSEARDFLRASLHRDRRRRVRATAALAVVLLTISVVALVAIQQRNEAGRQRNVAVSRELAGQAALDLDVDPARSVESAQRALAAAWTPQAERALRQATLQSRALHVLSGHRGRVLSTTYSSDGRLILSGGDDGMLRIWDAHEGALVDSIPTDQEIIYSVRFSQDDQHIASAGKDGTVVLTKVSNGEQRIAMRGPDQTYATSVAFVRDSTRLVAGFSDGSLRSVDTSSGFEPDAWQADEFSIYALAASPNRREVVSVGGDGNAEVWTIGEESARLVLSGHTGGATSATYSPLGDRIATGDSDGRIRTWNAENGQLMSEFLADQQDIWAVSYSPDGRQLLTASADGTAVLWSATGDRLLDFRGHRGSVYDAAFSPAGGQIVTGGRDSDVRVWDPADLFVATAPITRGSFNSDGSKIVTGGVDGQIRVWSSKDLAEPEIVLSGHEGRSWARFFRDGQRIVSSGEDGTVRVWDLRESTAPLVFAPHGQDAVYVTAAHPDGGLIASGGLDGRVVLTDVTDGGSRELIAGVGRVFEVIFSLNGRKLLVAGEDGVLRLWTGGEFAGSPTSLRGHVGAVFSAAFSRDGSHVVSGGADGIVRVWDLSDDESRPLALAGHQGEVESVQFNPDGTRVISGGIDGSVRVWDSASGNELVVIHRHEGKASSVDFSGDSVRVFSADEDNQTLLVYPCEVCGSLAEVSALARSRSKGT